MRSQVWMKRKKEILIVINGRSNRTTQQHSRNPFKQNTNDVCASSLHPVAICCIFHPFLPSAIWNRRFFSTGRSEIALLSNEYCQEMNTKKKYRAKCHRKVVIVIAIHLMNLSLSLSVMCFSRCVIFSIPLSAAAVVLV